MNGMNEKATKDPKRKLILEKTYGGEGKEGLYWCVNPYNYDYDAEKVKQALRDWKDLVRQIRKLELGGKR